MPNRKSNKQGAKNLGDITINDFANAAVCKNRPKKALTNVSKSIDVEKSWDEKTEEYEGDFIEQLNEDGSISYVISKEPRRRRKTIPSEEESIVLGNEYPLDIWYILSDYIRPEDVGRFAAICRSSYEVVRSAKFWYSLYKRYYRHIPDLPKHLQPEYLVRKYSLRTSVIRALHFMYPPFIERLKKANFVEHPSEVTRRQCVLMWHEKKKQNWFYNFKLKQQVIPSRNYSSTKPNFLELLDDVSANQDEHCQVLQVTCKQFIPLPPVLGLTLTSVSLTLCPGFISHKLLLVFSSGVSGNRPADGANCIILDPVINVRVLDWWHPLYPHSHNIEHLLSQE